MSTATGVIAVCCGEHARYSAFNRALYAMRWPAGTDVYWSVASKVEIGRNRAVLRALERGSEWIFFLDDDMLPQPDTLERLLRRDVDIVAALSLQRGNANQTEAFLDLGNTSAPLTLGPGIHKMAAVGAGATLYRTRVFRTLDHPWFEFEPRPSGCSLGEDLVLARKAAAAGFDMWCDYTTPVGHITEAWLYPDADQGTITARIGGQTTRIFDSRNGQAPPSVSARKT
jgi:hypothetical protein